MRDEVESAEERVSAGRAGECVGSGGRELQCPVAAAILRFFPRPPIYFLHQSATMLVFAIFFCNCNTPYNSASAVGGQPGT